MASKLPGFFQIPLLDEEDVIMVLPKLKATSSLGVSIVPGGDGDTVDTVR